MISALIDYIEKMTGNNLRSARATAPGHSNKPPPGSCGSGWGVGGLAMAVVSIRVYALVLLFC